MSVGGGSAQVSHSLYMTPIPPPSMTKRWSECIADAGHRQKSYVLRGARLIKNEFPCDR